MKANPLSATSKARYVRIELPGDARSLSLAEVEVIAGGKNVAVNQPATQSSTVYGGDAALAVDGNTDGDYNHKSVTHTSESTNPWWEVDLGSAVSIEGLNIHNRKGNEDRLEGFTVTLLDAQRKPVFRKKSVPADSVIRFE